MKDQSDAPRIGDWMQTFTGVAFWPLDPRPDEINLIDIAHSLSMQCRYAGHCRMFYSVAEHSVLMARAMSDDQAARVALMHDAPEAYLVDLPRPVKRHMPSYKTIEDRVWLAVSERFGLPLLGLEEVHEADNRILHDEQAQLMKVPPMSWNIKGSPLGVKIEGWAPDRARLEFLQTARDLGLD